MRENRYISLEELFKNPDALKRVGLEGIDVAFVPSSVVRYAKRNMPEDFGRAKRAGGYALAGAAESIRLLGYGLFVHSFF